LLDVSRLDAGVVEPHIKPVAVMPLLDSVTHGLQSLAQAKGLRLLVSARLESPWVLADPVLLRRILGNLAGNALRYTERGTVLLTVRPVHADGKDHHEPGAWRIECRDSGVGIPESEQQRIFDEFVQLHNPHRDRRHGLGLGLAIAQRCAQLLGSQIDVRSRPGQGSRFSLTLPAAVAVASAHEGVVHATVASRVDEAQHHDDPLLGRWVMIIDDEASIREGLSLLLSQWGCRPLAVADHEAALAAFNDEIDVVLADLRLPGGHSGLATLHALRAARNGTLPVCLITGESDPQALRIARDGGVPLLHKPVRVAQLRATLLHILRAEDHP